MACLLGTCVRYLILSDIHANQTAFEAVMTAANGRWEKCICLGDIVGYGPDPNESIDRVRALEPVAVVRGNHDKACSGITDASDFNPVARFAATWTHEQLTPDNLTYLRELPTGPARVEDFQIVHGSVIDEDQYVFRAGEARMSLERAEVWLTFFGHTHFQGGFVLRPNGKIDLVRLSLPPGPASAKLLLAKNIKYMINPGSIGQPRDGDPRAAFAFYDDQKRVLEYMRVPYDIAATQERMKHAGLPKPLGDRLALGR